MSDPLPPLREVIAACNLRAKKSLGQNFLLDLNITRKIARSIPDLESAQVIEVGPGPGGLTRGLLQEGAKKVIAIEKDGRATPALEAIKAAYPGRFDFLIGDALETNEESLISPGAVVHIAANLPYNIASALVAKWLETEPWPPFYRSITVMLQREVAERLIAKPSTKSFGRLSVMAQWRSNPEILFHLPQAAFTPPPKVRSTVIRLTPATPVVSGLKAKEVGAFTQLLFSKRRKTLKNVLKVLGPRAEKILKQEQIDAGLRAENLEIEAVCRLAKRFKA